MVPNGRGRAAILVIGLAAVSATGCSLEMLPPASELSAAPQVLTIRADPPEAHPGEVVNLEALVHWPGDDWEAHWLICMPQGADGLSSCVADNFPADGVVPDCVTAPTASLCRVGGGITTQVLVPPFLQLPPDVSFPVLVQLLAARESEGWTGCLDAVANGEPNEDCLLAIKIAWVSSDPQPNRNPEPVSLVVGGQTHDALAPPLLLTQDASDLGDFSVLLELVVDATSVDEMVDDDGVAQDAALDVAWFVTCGTIDVEGGGTLRGDDSLNPRKMNCTPPPDGVGPGTCSAAQATWSPQEPGTCVVHAVVNDGRGGIGFLTRTFEVRGTPAIEEDITLSACNCGGGGGGGGGGARGFIFGIGAPPSLLLLGLPLLLWLFGRRWRARDVGKVPTPMAQKPRPRSLVSLLLLGLVFGGSAGCGDSGGGDNHTVDAATPPAPIEVSGPSGRIDFAYHLALAEEDPTGQIRTYDVNLGALPPGLSLALDGTVSGTPTASGIYEVIIWGDSGCLDASCRLVVLLTIEVLPVILLSGYGPFAGVPDNPSWAGVAPLHEALIGGYDVRTIELTVTWDHAWEVFEMEYERLRPAMVIGAGVAMGELVIRLESRAANYALGEDVDGVIKDELIDPDGEARTSGLPLADLLELLQNEGYPVVISDNAGTYLCNYLFYLLMRRVEAEPAAANILGGFVHVPGEDVVSIADMTDAWQLMLGYLAGYRDSLQRKERRPGDRPWKASVHRPPRYLYSRALPDLR